MYINMKIFLNYKCCRNTQEEHRMFSEYFIVATSSFFYILNPSPALNWLFSLAHIPWTKRWCSLPSDLHHLNPHSCLRSILSTFHPCQPHMPCLSPVACVCLSWLKLQIRMCRSVSVFKAQYKDDASY